MCLYLFWWNYMSIWKKWVNCYYCVVVNLWLIAFSICFMIMRILELVYIWLQLWYRLCGFLSLSKLKGFSSSFLISKAWSLFGKIKIEMLACFPFFRELFLHLFILGQHVCILKYQACFCRQKGRYCSLIQQAWTI